ncbi:hypothetical protein TRAPUB_7860 [Trametes pubescens]|uniref:Uncharacterized protein n=1 Tax=Trametes pubescens TaxID=154538 RepID=A0A1M2V2J7_TRAPU|nr:hypothetical protein TRAPUB_7860 [Trametes pubescens]
MAMGRASTPEHTHTVSTGFAFNSGGSAANAGVSSPSGITGCSDSDEGGEKNDGAPSVRVRSGDIAEDWMQDGDPGKPEADGSATPRGTLQEGPPAPEWCADVDFVQALRDAQERLWTSIRGAKDQLYSEVWSYSFDNATNTFSVTDLAALSPSGTESDAIQLWSYGFLAIADPDSREWHTGDVNPRSP